MCFSIQSSALSVKGVIVAQICFASFNMFIWFDGLLAEIACVLLDRELMLLLVLAASENSASE